MHPSDVVLQVVQSLTDPDLRKQKACQWSLDQDEGMAVWKHAIDRWRPLLVIMDINCTEWTTVQGINYSASKGNLHVLHEMREKVRPTINMCTETAAQQAMAGRLFLIGQPLGSTIPKDLSSRRCCRYPV